MARDKIDRVFDLVESKMSLLRSWGVGVRKVAPWLWCLDDNTDLIRLRVTPKHVVIYILSEYGLFQDYEIPMNRRWKEIERELGGILNKAIGAAVMSLFRSTMPRGTAWVYRDDFFVIVKFRLHERKGWSFEIATMGGKRLAALHGSKRQSPLSRFDEVKRLLFVTVL